MIFRLLFLRRRAAATGNLGLNLAPLLQGQNSGRNAVARDARLRTDLASSKSNFAREEFLECRLKLRFFYLYLKG